ncbi:MAG: CDP-diacylglycerol--glycerol-3-phosphate 3-phosphatidyltransferase [Pseudomonadota bacterium]
MFKSLPNILTISRIVSIPLILVFFYIGGKYGEAISASLFLLACITDFLDGYLARTFAIQSKLGRFLDPIADKLLIGSVIVLLVYYRKADLLPAIAIICREILVSGLREFLAEIRVSVPVSNLAKVKTFFQMGAIFILLLGSKQSGIEYLDELGRVSLWIAAGLTLFTGYVYFKSGLKHIE